MNRDSDIGDFGLMARAVAKAVELVFAIIGVASSIWFAASLVADFMGGLR